MVDETQMLLDGWRSNPNPDAALRLCRALAERAIDSPQHRHLLGEIAPQIANRHGREVALQLELARACLAGKQFHFADAVLKPLLQIAPNDPAVWKLLGEVFLRAGNANDAETAFEGALARGLRDVDTVRWHEKARNSKAMQKVGGAGAVADEIERWITSGGIFAPASKKAASDLESTVIHDSPFSQPSPSSKRPQSDLESTVIRDSPLAAQEALAAAGPKHDKAPDSDRTKFYQKPPPAAGARPPPPAPPPPGSARSRLSAHDEIVDEQSNVDVTKLPDGDKLDDVLEKLREREGLVIEDPTNFVELPPGMKLPEPVDMVAEAAKRPAGPVMLGAGTQMMPASPMQQPNAWPPQAPLPGGDSPFAATGVSASRGMQPPPSQPAPYAATIPMPAGMGLDGSQAFAPTPLAPQVYQHPPPASPLPEPMGGPMQYGAPAPAAPPAKSTGKAVAIVLLVALVFAAAAAAVAYRMGYRPAFVGSLVGQQEG